MKTHRTGVALEDIWVGLIGKCGVAPVPVCRHIPSSHVRALHGQRAWRQDWKWPEEEIFAVLRDNKTIVGWTLHN